MLWIGKRHPGKTELLNPVDVPEMPYLYGKLNVLFGYASMYSLSRQRDRDQLPNMNYCSCGS